MADDAVIRVGVQADVSNLQAGMKEAQATVTASCSRMEQAYAHLAQATVDYAGKTATLRDAIKQLVTGAIPYTESQKILVPILKEQAAATEALRTAKADLARSESAETEVLRSNITTRMAASSELRMFSGNLQSSTRAAGALLSTLPGIGAAMQAAFPIFGAVALVEVLGQAFGAVNRLVTAYESLSGAAIKASTDAILAGEKIARIKANSFTADSFARVLAGAPASQDVQVRSASAALKQIEYARELADAQAAVVEEGKKGVELQRQKIADAQKDIDYARQAKKAADDLVNSYKAQLEAKTTIGIATTDPKSGVISQPKVINTITDPKQIEAIQSQLRAAVEASERFNHDIDLMKVKLQGAELKLPSIETKADDSAARKALEAQRKAEEEAVQAARQTLDSLKATRAMSVIDESQFWAGMAVESKVGSKLYITGWDEANKATARAQEEAKRSLDRWADDAKEKFAQQTRASEELARKQAETAEAGRESINRIAEAQARASETVQEATVHANEASGAISQLAAAKELARIHAASYREELKRLDDELTKLSEDESLTPEQRAQKEGQLQAQKIQVQGSMQATGIQDSSAIMREFAAPYETAFGKVNDEWIQVQNRILSSTRNISQAFAEMGQHLLTASIDSLEKWALKTVEKELIVTLAHRAGVLERVATDKSGAATSEAISKVSAMQQGLAAAKLAFKNTYSVVSGWPVVGPILAPVLASAAYVGVAAFEEGTPYVPSTGLALLHEGEAVIPKGEADEWRDGDVGRGGGDLHIHNTNNINAPTEKAILRAIERNPHVIAGTLRKHLRQTGRG